MPDSKAKEAMLIGYDGWFEPEMQVLTGLGLPDDFLVGPRKVMLSTIASLFLHPDFIDDFSQAMAWLSLVGCCEAYTANRKASCYAALAIIGGKLGALAQLPTPFAWRNMIAFVDKVIAYLPALASDWNREELSLESKMTYSGEMSEVLHAIALEHTSLACTSVDFYDRAVARLALWAAGAQVPLSRTDYAELMMTVGYPYQAWRKPDLTNPRACMALFVLEHARLRARIEGIENSKA